MGKELGRGKVLLQKMRIRLQEAEEILAFVNHHIEAQPNREWEEIA